MKKKSQLKIANAKKKKKRICGNPRTERYSVRDRPWMATNDIVNRQKRL